MMLYGFNSGALLQVLWGDLLLVGNLLLRLCQHLNISKLTHFNVQNLLLLLLREQLSILLFQCFLSMCSGNILHLQPRLAY